MTPKKPIATTATATISIIQTNNHNEYEKECDEEDVITLDLNNLKDETLLLFNDNDNSNIARMTVTESDNLKHVSILFLILYRLDFNQTYIL